MTPAQIALLKTELADTKYSGKTSAEIAGMLLARPLIPNPNPQPQVPRPLTASDAAALKLTGIGDGMLAQLHSAIQAQDNKALAGWAVLAVSAGLITGQLGTAIQNYANQTVPDPKWPAKVPGNNRLAALGITKLEWGGMTFTGSIPKDAVESVLKEIVGVVRNG